MDVIGYLGGQDRILLAIASFFIGGYAKISE